MSRSLTDYYAERAPEYERVYQKPERQQELAALARLLRSRLAEEDLLEIACGTGYWTELLAPVVRSLVATDANVEVLELARLKSYPAGRVSLEVADAYAPAEIAGQFTAGFAGFWWSHVPRQRLIDFLHGLHQRLGVGARVVFCDNRFSEGSSTPISRVDAAGNSYQRRRLDGGQEYEIVKNFPKCSELVNVLAHSGAVEVTLDELRYYWCVSYRIGAVTSH